MAVKRSASTGRILLGTGRRPKRCTCCDPMCEGLCCGEPRNSPCTWTPLDPTCDPEFVPCPYRVGFAVGIEYGLTWTRHVGDVGQWHDSYTFPFNRDRQFTSQTLCDAGIQFTRFEWPDYRIIPPQAGTRDGRIRSFLQEASVRLGSANYPVGNPLGVRTGPLDVGMPVLDISARTEFGSDIFTFGGLSWRLLASMRTGEVAVDINATPESSGLPSGVGTVNASAVYRGQSPCRSGVDLTADINIQWDNGPPSSILLTTLTGSVTFRVDITGVQNCCDGGTEGCSGCDDDGL